MIVKKPSSRGHWALLDDGDDPEELAKLGCRVKRDRHGQWWLYHADLPTNPEHEWGPGPEW